MRIVYPEIERSDLSVIVPTDEQQTIMLQRLPHVQKRFLAFLAKNQAAELEKIGLNHDDIVQIATGAIPATQNEPWVFHLRVPVHLGGKPDIANMCLMRASASEAFGEFLNFQIPEFVPGQKVTVELAQPKRGVWIYPHEIGDQLIRPYLEIKRNSLILEAKAARLERARWLERQKPAAATPASPRVNGVDRGFFAAKIQEALASPVKADATPAPVPTPAVAKPAADPEPPSQLLAVTGMSLRLEPFRVNTVTKYQKESLRNSFGQRQRGHFLRLLAETHKEELLQNGFTEEDIQKMRQGNLPQFLEGEMDNNHPNRWRIHHVRPLGLGGDNSLDNLCLIRVGAEALLHSFINKQMAVVTPHRPEIQIEILVPVPRAFCPMTPEQVRAELPKEWRLQQADGINRICLFSPVPEPAANTRHRRSISPSSNIMREAFTKAYNNGNGAGPFWEKPVRGR
jgi:hypothetical protein